VQRAIVQATDKKVSFTSIKVSDLLIQLFVFKLVCIS
jgi:hypothetical protein